MYLSKNLTLADVIRSNTAKKLNINNSQMTIEMKENMIAIAKNIFQPTYDNLGKLTVTSGFRSEALNKAIEGSLTSQHSKGEALDLQGVNLDNSLIFNFIKENLDFDQLIWEFGDNENPNWVHVSYKKNGHNRKSILKSLKINGKTNYQHWNI